MENEGKRHYLNNRKCVRRLRPAANAEELYPGSMFYFTCIGEREELQPVYDHFSKDRRYRCTIQQEIYRPETWCEIMPAKATKVHATGVIGSNEEDGVAQRLAAHAECGQ